MPTAPAYLHPPTLRWVADSMAAGPVAPADLRALADHADAPDSGGACAAAERDWRAHGGEHDRSAGGILDRMFTSSGYSSRGVPKGPTDKVPEWCGMAVVSWLLAAGLNPNFNTSFLHTFNVEAFFTYGAARNVNPSRLDTEVRPAPAAPWRTIKAWHEQALRPRRWLAHAAIFARGGPAGGTARQDLFAPGDVLLIDWSGGRNDADHIALVRAWDGDGLLDTFEGNRHGKGPAGEDWREAVVACRYDISDPAVRALMYGVGRCSPLDFGREDVR